MLVDHIKKYWHWLLLVLVVFVIGCVISWEGSALAALVWFSTKQVADIRKKRKDITNKTESVAEDLEEETTRQKDADANLEKATKAARDSVDDTWDTENTRDTPGLN